MEFDLGGFIWFRFLWGANAVRDLTEEELKLAPDGFSEYGFNRSGGVFFFNRDKGVAVIGGVDNLLSLLVVRQS